LRGGYLLSRIYTLPLFIIMVNKVKQTHQ
jgi:hypothetical protein